MDPWSSPEARTHTSLDPFCGRFGGAPCAVPALHARCAKKRLLWTHSPRWSMSDRNSYCVPRHRTAQILTQPKNSDNELKQTRCRTENAGLRSKSAVSALWSPPGGGWGSGWSQETSLPIGRCARAVQQRPHITEFTS